MEIGVKRCSRFFGLPLRLLRSGRTFPRPSHCRPRLEALEDRTLPTVTSLFDPVSGALSVTATANDAVRITASLGNVQVNGADPDSGATASGSVLSIALTGTAASGPGGSRFDLSGIQATDFTALTGIQVTGGGGSDTLVGPDVPLTWDVTGLNSGAVLGGPAAVSFSSVENLVGGTAADSFVFADGASLSGGLDGGAGGDTLDFSDYSTPLLVHLTGSTTDGFQGSAPPLGAAGFANIATLLGGNGSDTLQGESVASTWTLADTLTYKDGGNALIFSGFETLQGGSAPNRFDIQGDSLGLVTADLKGGSGDDTFGFTDGATLIGSIDGGPGTDTLDYSHCTTPVSVNLAAGTATAVSGSVQNVENAIGGSGGISVIGKAVATVALNTLTPRMKDVLTATATASDPDGKSVTLTYVWTVNGHVVRTTAATTALTDHLDLSQTGNGDKGDSIVVTVTPNDGILNGAAVSSTAVVQDALPVVDSVTITSTPPGPTQVLTANVNGHDDDGDSVTFAYQWSRGGTLISGAAGSTLDLGQTGLGSAGGSFTVTVTPTAAGATGTAVTSAAIVIAAPDNRGFLTRVFQDVLSRSPGSTELSGGLDYLAAARLPVLPDVALTVLTSDEYRGNVVLGYYSEVGVTPAPGNVDSWVGRMRGGMSAEQVHAAFLATDAYFGRVGGTDDSFVRSLYGLVSPTGYVPQARDVASWDQALAGGTTRQQAALAFLSSSLYRLSFVQRCYGEVGVTPSQTNLDYWTTQLRGGMTPEQVHADFLGTDAYFRQHLDGLGLPGNGAWLAAMVKDVLGHAPLSATTLAGAITAGQTTLTVASATGYPAGGRFFITIDAETLLVTGVSGTTLTVQRGCLGTVPAAHAAGAAVQDATNLGGLMNQLVSGYTSQRQAVAAGLLGSTDYLMGLVKGYYAEVGMTPTDANVTTWVQSLRGGMADEEVRAAFLATDAYFQKAGGSNAGFVSALYALLTPGYTPSATDLTHWQNALAGGTSRQDVARAFLTSSLHRAGLVRQFYAKVGLTPTQADVDHWVNEMAFGATVELVRAVFLSTPSYFLGMSP